jgi:hypothetical protein
LDPDTYLVFATSDTPVFLHLGDLKIVLWTPGFGAVLHTSSARDIVTAIR